MAQELPPEQSQSIITALARQWAEANGIQDVEGFVRAMLAVAGAESSLINTRPGDAGTSQGLFQLHEGGKGAGMSVEARQDPTVNAAKALSYLGPVYKDAEAQGQDWNTALQRMTGPEGQNPADPAQLYANALAWAGASQPGAIPQPGATPPVGQTEIPFPDPGHYFVMEEVPALMENGLPAMDEAGNPMTKVQPVLDDRGEPMLDYVAYGNAVKSWQGLYPEQQTEEEKTNLVDYVTQVLNQLQTEVAAGNLRESQASRELQGRLGALSEGRQLFEELLPISMPKGAEYVPGGWEPGGVMEQIGLQPQKATPIEINPFALALQTIQETEGGTPVDLSVLQSPEFQGALEELRRAGMAGGAAGPTIDERLRATYPTGAAGEEAVAGPPPDTALLVRMAQMFPNLRPEIEQILQANVRRPGMDVVQTGQPGGGLNLSGVVSAAGTAGATLADLLSNPAITGAAGAIGGATPIGAPLNILTLLNLLKRTRVPGAFQQALGWLGR